MNDYYCEVTIGEEHTFSNSITMLNRSFHSKLANFHWFGYSYAKLTNFADDVMKFYFIKSFKNSASLSVQCSLPTFTANGRIFADYFEMKNLTF